VTAHKKGVKLVWECSILGIAIFFWLFYCRSRYILAKPHICIPTKKDTLSIHSRSGLSSAPSAFDMFVWYNSTILSAHSAFGSSSYRVSTTPEGTKVDTRDLIILIIGPPKHHTNNESNHQHCRTGHDLRQRLSSGTPWRSGCKYMLNLLSHQPLRFLRTKQTLTSFISAPYFSFLSLGFFTVVGFYN